MIFAPGQQIHISGVGGAGMSGLARLLIEQGCLVSGSDDYASPVLDELAARGVAVHVGRVPNIAEAADVMTWSPALDAHHPELVAAHATGVHLVDRAHVLEALSAQYRIIGCTGTHGKTTATSMLAHVFAAAGRDAGRLLGAPVRGVGPNGHAGSTGELLLEVDESYGSFALVTAEALAVLNIEADHLDHYGTLVNLEASFAALVNRTRGPVVLWGDDEGVQRIREQAPRPVSVVGRSPTSQWRVSDEVLTRSSATFQLNGPEVIPIELGVTGAHNVANAAVVAVLARACGIDTEAVRSGLRNFVGAPRRFEFRGTWRGMDVIEDYAHLPGEIAATIACARAIGYQRIACVFQPHRYSRTVAVGEGFAPAFDDADAVIVTAIYGAGEAPIPGVSESSVATSLQHRRSNVTAAATVDEVGEEVRALKNVDVLLVLGAGDIGELLSTLVGESWHDG